MEKKTLKELCDLDNWEVAVIVFTTDSFDREYSELERSYEVSRENKFFHDWMISNSIFGNCLDGTDQGVRLDWYMSDGWKVDYCYITKQKPTDGNQ